MGLPKGQPGQFTEVGFPESVYRSVGSQNRDSTVSVKRFLTTLLCFSPLHSVGRLSNTVSTDLYELFRTVVEVHITKKVHITFLSLPMRGKANRGKFPHKHTSGQVDSQRIWSSQDGRQAKNQVFDRAQSRGS